MELILESFLLLLECFFRLFISLLLFSPYFLLVRLFRLRVYIFVPFLLLVLLFLFLAELLEFSELCLIVSSLVIFTILAEHHSSDGREQS